MSFATSQLIWRCQATSDSVIILAKSTAYRVCDFFGSANSIFTWRSTKHVRHNSRDRLSATAPTCRRSAATETRASRPLWHAPTDGRSANSTTLRGALDGHRNLAIRILRRTVLVASNPKGVVQEAGGHVGSRDMVDCFLTPNHSRMFTLSQLSARISRMNPNANYLTSGAAFR